MQASMKKQLQAEIPFLLVISLLSVVSALTYDAPEIAMWVGFCIAGYSAIANDSIQTLGTFLSSNNKVPWWLLWIFVGGYPRCYLRLWLDAKWWRHRL